MSDSFYLREDAIVQPLVCGWPAWAHLIAPGTAALNLRFKYLPLVESFLVDPEAHRLALSDPELRGGPFVDLPDETHPKLQALLAGLKERASVMDLAQGIRELDNITRALPSGRAADELYDLLPDALAGAVEFAYGHDHRLKFRLIEGALYRGSGYDRQLQSVLICPDPGDERPFALASPAFPCAGSIELKLPFASSELATLLRSRENPVRRDQLSRILQEDPENFPGLFSRSKPIMRTTSSSPPSERLRWRYLGHACVLIETEDKAILVDPLVSSAIGSTDRFSIDDLPSRIDYVLITHGHQDHLIPEVLLRLRDRIGTVVVPKSFGDLVDPSLCLVLRELGFVDVRELDAFDSITDDGLTVMAAPFFGEHGDLAVAAKGTYLVKGRAGQAFFAADTRNIQSPAYDLIVREHGAIDVLFVGMECHGAPLSWLYAPLLAKPVSHAQDHERRLNGSNCREALALTKSLKAKEVHVYAMGMEPWVNFLTATSYDDESRPILEARQFVEACLATGVRASILSGRVEGTL